jgi:hypothetical protein
MRLDGFAHIHEAVFNDGTRLIMDYGCNLFFEDAGSKLVDLTSQFKHGDLRVFQSYLLEEDEEIVLQAIDSISNQLDNNGKLSS